MPETYSPAPPFLKLRLVNRSERARLLHLAKELKDGFTVPLRLEVRLRAPGTPPPTADEGYGNEAAEQRRRRWDLNPSPYSLLQLAAGDAEVIAFSLPSVAARPASADAGPLLAQARLWVLERGAEGRWTPVGPLQSDELEIRWPVPQAMAGNPPAFTRPQLLRTDPASGGGAVAPGPRDIVVEFDRPMDRGGFSFTGGGPSFPILRGQAFWRSEAICALPVFLEEDREYVIGLNGPGNAGFRSAQGVALQPQKLIVRTRAVSLELARHAQKESIAQLHDLISTYYSYRALRFPDFGPRWIEAEPELKAAVGPRAFAEAAARLLALTKDPHIWLEERGETIPSYRRTVTLTADYLKAAEMLTAWKRPHAMLAQGIAPGGIGYLAIHSWENRQVELLPAALAALKELRDLPALIVDVRANQGGDETLAKTFAGCFVRERAHYASHVDLDPAAPGGFTAPVQRWLEPNRNGLEYRGKVIVLMGPLNMSSAESFLLMMKQVPGARLVGERSTGASGNPRRHRLANGVTVLLPSWKALLPDGTEWETRGIAPDVEVRWDPEAEVDPVLARAIELAR